ncbi:MAG: hypothetical protein IPO40_23725 [Fibrobacteres bacterium]|nr:hypothetical protein [Fibrobacterota bacterium]
MQILNEFLKMVPDVIWSGIIASFLTLSGVLISNSSNTKRLRMQLDHDSNEKMRERTATMRRQVYLDATEELVKIGATLSSLPNKDLKDDFSGKEWAQFQKASSQAQLIANPETAAKVLKVSGMYSSLFLELTEKLIPIGLAKEDIKIADTMRKQGDLEIQRILKEMSEINENPKVNSKSFLALQQNMEFQQKQTSLYAKNAQDGWKRFNQSNIEYQRIIMARVKEISPHALDLIDSMRKDLCIEGDYAEYRKISYEQIQGIEQRMERLYGILQGHTESFLGQE